MRKLIVIGWLLISVSMGFAQEDVVTNATVIEMTKSGLSPEIVKAKINSSATNFDTSTGAIKRLMEAGVPEAVILAMIEKGRTQRSSESAGRGGSFEAVDSIPEQGNLSNVVGKKRVYIYADDPKSRDIITKVLNKKGEFQIVDRLEDSDFLIKFEVWSESVGAVARTYRNTTTVSESKVRLGLFTVIMPSDIPNRLRHVYSIKKSQPFIWNDHPAESTTKQFLKDLAKITTGK